MLNFNQGPYLKSDYIVKIMESVDRKDFIENSPYSDSPQSLGYGVTISAPHMHAYCLDLLENYLKPGMKALDIGSGSGYLTACMGRMVYPKGKVIGIEYIHPIMEQSLKNLQKDEFHQKLLKEKIIEIKCMNGKNGYKDEAPYNTIHVGAAAIKIPEELINQLAIPGRLIIPVGVQGGIQELICITKTLDGLKQESLLKVSYVPLV